MESGSGQKERFVYHGAWLAGRGSSSYIHTVIRRPKKAKLGWTGLSDDAPGADGIPSPDGRSECLVRDASSARKQYRLANG